MAHAIIAAVLDGDGPDDVLIAADREDG
jgi:hypothetical protein